MAATQIAGIYTLQCDAVATLEVPRPIGSLDFIVGGRGVARDSRSGGGAVCLNVSIVIRVDTTMSGHSSGHNG